MEMRAPRDVPQQWVHLPIKHLILATSDFAVFVDDKNEVDWETTDAFEASGRADSPAFNDIHNSATHLECLPCEDLTERQLVNLRKMTALAIARGLQGDTGNASAMIKHAEAYYRGRMREVSRIWYLAGSGSAALVLSILGGALWLSRNESIAWLGQGAFYILLAAALGGLGAMFSVIQRAGNMDRDPSAGRNIYRIEGFSRVVAGAIAGSLVALGVKSRLVGPLLNDGSQIHLSMLMLGFVSGVGERWLPSIVSKHLRAHGGAHEQEGGDVRL